MTKSFAHRIAAMNAMYSLPANDRPALPEDVIGRLTKFKATLMDEVHEIDEPGDGPPPRRCRWSLETPNTESPLPVRLMS